jgi:hypothetical protein
VTRSEQIAALAKALATAQRELEGASKDSVNPHFKSKYADLAAVWEACQKVLPKNGIAVIQPVTVVNGEVVVTTMLVHESGEFISCDLPLVPTQSTPQAVGSAITYGRRYGLSSMVGVAPEDDDGNAASSAVTRQSSRPQAVKDFEPEGFQDWWTDMIAVADEGEEALRQAWTSSPAHLRAYATKHKATEWAALKAKTVSLTGAAS